MTSQSNYSALAYFCRWSFYIHHPCGLVWSCGVRIQCSVRETGANWQMEPGAERKTRTPHHTERWKTAILLFDHLQCITVTKWWGYLKLLNKARTNFLSVTGQSLKFKTFFWSEIHGEERKIIERASVAVNVTCGRREARALGLWGFGSLHVHLSCVFLAFFPTEFRAKERLFQSIGIY